MTLTSRRRLFCREIPRGLAALIGLFSDRGASEAGDDAAFAAFDAEWRAMGPDMLAQAAQAAGLAGAGSPAVETRDDIVKALWQRRRTDSDVG
jgi:hypothetical protein